MFTEHGFMLFIAQTGFLTGLSSDLVVKQTLMKSVKSRSGLSRDRGIDERIVLVLFSLSQQYAL